MLFFLFWVDNTACSDTFLLGDFAGSKSSGGLLARSIGLEANSSAGDGSKSGNGLFSNNFAGRDGFCGNNDR